jgi:transcription initiation factor IIE alpha subunit
MAKCPKCNEALSKPDKSWKYGIFQVEAFTCQNCKTQFREYTKSGKYAFTLKLEKGKGYIKA